MTLRVVPSIHAGSRSQVHAFISEHHRHHKPPLGEIARLACVDEAGTVRGVLTMGRPVARHSDDGWTLEVTRLSTDGTRNACSLLYGAARRIAWAMGCRRLVTYTLPSEGGASLRAAGWVEEGAAGGGEWSCASRPREASERPDTKTRWACYNPKAHQGEVKWPEPDLPPLPLFGGGAR